MIPIRDSVFRRGRANVVLALIALNVLVFVYMIDLAPRDELGFVLSFGLLPIVYTPPDHVLIVQLSAFDYVTPFVTYSFLHGGWLHLIFNMWTLWIFGRTMESRLGAGRFFLFYLTAGAAAGAVHVAFNPGSQIPVVGASGAIAGVIGAYAFTYPRAEITVLIPIIIIPLFIDVPALLFAALWFGVQLLQAWNEMGAPDRAGIAWWAHAGGFVAGALLLPLFATSERRPKPWDHFRRR